MKKVLYIILGVSMIMGLVSGCSEQALEELEEPKEILTVGMELDHAPFETIDEGGNPFGISVEIAYSLGEYLNRSVVIKNMTHEELLSALNTGKIDLIISSIAITDAKLESVNFSDPYAKSFLAMLVNRNSSVNEFNDLNESGRKVVVKKGTTGHTYAEDNLPEENIVVLENEPDCLLEVTQGKVDVFLYDPVSVYKNAQANSDTTRAVLKTFQDEFEYWGIAVNKDEEQLLVEVNMFLNEFQSSGDMDILTDYYLGEVKFKFEKQNIEFLFLDD